MKISSILLPIVLVGISKCSDVFAHDWSGHADSGVKGVPFAASFTSIASAQTTQRIETTAVGADVGSTPSPAVELRAAVFRSFKPHVQFRFDANYFYVESEGMPSHGMMVGITAWQQQVPIPQDYFGNNAWRLPIEPVVAKTPYLIDSKNFLRGAVALAVNGVPIFNPYNNRGEISLLIGELDQWGGHCGRADDYHYHVAPLHLTNIVGVSSPIAFALDGYPIYGLTEPSGATPTGLDAFNGHDNGAGYHYHSSTKAPYVNGGFHGVVRYAGGQVDPQPRTPPLRAAGAPLRGASIVGFTNSAPDQYQLTYSLAGQNYVVQYVLNRDGGTVQFQFVSPSRTTTQSYDNWRPNRR